MGLKTIGSLWVGKAGSKAKLSGYMDGPNRTKGPKVFVFPNEKATAENRQPQYRLCVEEADEQPAPYFADTPPSEKPHDPDDDVAF